MDKPSDYGSDIRGSNPLRGTKFQPINPPPVTVNFK